MASFWSMWIIVLTTITIVGITWMLFANRKGEQQPEEKTTGHEYDGIQELDNPLPWVYFYYRKVRLSRGSQKLLLRCGRLGRP